MAKKSIKNKPQKTRVLWDRPPTHYIKESKKRYDRTRDKKDMERGMQKDD